MKLVEFALTLVFVTPFAVMAQGDMKGMNQKSVPMETRGQTTYKAAGTVKTVDKIKGTVTLAHGPVKELKWSSMTMTFGVMENSMLEKLAAGKKVDFEFVQQGKDYIVTRVK